MTMWWNTFWRFILFFHTYTCFSRLYWNGPDLIWAPDVFGPQKIWSPRGLGPAWKSHVMIFMRGSNFLGEQISQRPNFLGSKFLGDQISWGPLFLGTKKVRGPDEIGDHFSYSPFPQDYLAHWIQQPIPNLQILNFH